MNITRIIFALCVMLAPLSAIASSSQVLLITQLYREFAWEAGLAAAPANPVPFAQQPMQKLRSYFTPRLAALLSADSACAGKKGMCKIDFAVLWDSQDPVATDLKISKGVAHRTIIARYRAPDSKEQISITFELRRSSVGWRIADIHYRSGASLTRLLQ
jgi:hypothetical protein